MVQTPAYLHKATARILENISQNFPIKILAPSKIWLVVKLNKLILIISPYLHLSSYCPEILPTYVMV